MNASKMITANHLEFSYRKSGKKLFDNFSLSLDKGKIYGLLGKNGVGKSTLLYLLTGLLVPVKGEVLFEGTNVRKRSVRTLRDMFIVPEEFELPPISLINYIELNAPFYPKFSKEEMVKYLHFFEMSIDQHLGTLSMGQKKKVFMSFALATNTAFLIMDEPTNGLDIPGKSQFRKFLAAGMSDDKSIIISTHQVKDVEKILDHIIIMDHNRVLLNETVNEISNTLTFQESERTEPEENALFTLPSPLGNHQILVKGEGSETEINLELLFNGVLTHPGKFSSLFNTKNS